MNQPLKINYRENVVPGDIAIVEDLVKSTGFFNLEEIHVAVELVDARHLGRCEARLADVHEFEPAGVGEAVAVGVGPLVRRVLRLIWAES